MSSSNAGRGRYGRGSPATAAASALAAITVLATGILATGALAVAAPGDYRSAPLGPTKNRITAAGTITFGRQMGGVSDGACSKIKVREQTSSTDTQVDATGPAVNASKCTYMIAVPPGVLVKLSVVYEDLLAKPKGWANPVRVNPDVRYNFVMDGKP